MSIKQINSGFWQNRPLESLRADEWEALCDGCGRCCLLKLEDEETGKVFYTSVACRLLAIDACRCGDYDRRFAQVPGCVRVRPDNIARLDWLPETCAYRRLYLGCELPEWHYLVCGDREAVHRAGASVRGFALSENHVHPDSLQDFVLVDDEQDDEEPGAG